MKRGKKAFTLPLNSRNAMGAVLTKTLLYQTDHGCFPLAFKHELPLCSNYHSLILFFHQFNLLLMALLA